MKPVRTDLLSNQEFSPQTSWDFFTSHNGSKPGDVSDLDETGCTLRTREIIDFRRWIRLLIRFDGSNVTLIVVGRVVRCLTPYETVKLVEPAPSYSYAVEFNAPIRVRPS